MQGHNLARNAASNEATCPPSAAAFTTLMHMVMSNFYSKQVADQFIEDEYDFIVVGGGTAGAVVANMLTERSGWQVLVLERGGDEAYEGQIPAKPPLDQIQVEYMTEPDGRACLSRPEGRCSWPRGIVLGGCSAHNGMVYARGSKRDYDIWQEMGNEGWGYDGVSRWFLSTEGNRDPKYKDSSEHGKYGYQSVQTFPYADDNVFAFIEAWKQQGLKETDVSVDTRPGVMRCLATSKYGERFSTNRAFLRSARKRPNLHVAKHTLVTKILIHPKSKTAYGVEYKRQGKMGTVRATKEVILSAGAINSPQILLLSGVGPRKHLEQMNIPVVHDLPVGYNLMDQLSMDGVVILLNKTATNVDEEQKKCDEYVYYKNRKGPLSGTGPYEIVAYYKSKLVPRNQSSPDFHFVHKPIFREEYFKDPNNPKVYSNTLAYYDAIMICPTYGHPTSRGRIELNSTNPEDHPKIYSGYFEKEDDLNALLQGVQAALKLSRSKAIKNIGGKLATTPLPGCKDYDVKSRDYWKCVATHYTATSQHPAGTCKMGPVNDLTAVVDPRLRVQGIKNLRVIDASIMPRLPSSSINAPTIMIGAKGSYMIDEDWYNPDA